MQDRASEYDVALKICGQWTSADAVLQGKTPKEHEAGLEQWLAEADARFLAEQAQAERDRAVRASHYDRDRDQARLALLEVQGILGDAIRQRDEILSGDLFPLASEKDRRHLLASLERDIAAKTREAADLPSLSKWADPLTGSITIDTTTM